MGAVGELSWNGRKQRTLKIARVSPVGIPLVMHLIPAAAAGIMEV